MGAPTVSAALAIQQLHQSQLNQSRPRHQSNPPTHPPIHQQELKEQDACFEPVLLGAAVDESPEAFSSASSGLAHANSAPPVVGNRQAVPPGARTGRPRPYFAPDVQDRQPRLSVFQRTFSERVGGLWWGVNGGRGCGWG